MASTFLCRYLCVSSPRFRGPGEHGTLLTKMTSSPFCVCAPCSVILCFFQPRGGTSPAPLKLGVASWLAEPKSMQQKRCHAGGDQAPRTRTSFCSLLEALCCREKKPRLAFREMGDHLRPAEPRTGSAAGPRCPSQPSRHEPSLAQRPELTSYR